MLFQRVVLSSFFLFKISSQSVKGLSRKLNFFPKRPSNQNFWPHRVIFRCGLQHSLDRIVSRCLCQPHHPLEAQPFFSFATAVYSLGGYNWLHHGNFLISTQNPARGTPIKQINFFFIIDNQSVFQIEIKKLPRWHQMYPPRVYTATASKKFAGAIYVGVQTKTKFDFQSQ